MVVPLASSEIVYVRPGKMMAGPATSAGEFCRPVSVPAVVPTGNSVVPSAAGRVAVTANWSVVARRPATFFFTVRLAGASAHDARSLLLTPPPRVRFVPVRSPVMGLAWRTWVAWPR